MNIETKLFTLVENNIFESKIIKVGNPIIFGNSIFDEITAYNTSKAIDMVNENFKVFGEQILTMIIKNICADISFYRIKYTKEELIKYIYLHLYITLTESNLGYEAVLTKDKLYIKLLCKIGTFSYFGSIMNTNSQKIMYTRNIIIFPQSKTHHKIINNWKIAKKSGVQIPFFTEDYQMLNNRSFRLFSVEFMNPIDILKDDKLIIIADLISNIQNLNEYAFHMTLNPSNISRTLTSKPRKFIINNFDHLSTDKIDEDTFSVTITNPYIPNSETGKVTKKDQIKGIIVCVEYMFTKVSLQKIHEKFQSIFDEIDAYDSKDIYNKVVCSLIKN